MDETPKTMTDEVQTFDVREWLKKREIGRAHV